MKTRDLGFAHLGNGISVYDRSNEEHGDYERVAHIANNRVITYSKKLSASDTLKVERFACFEHPNISTTQDAKVFITDPCEPFDTSKYKVAIEYYNSGKAYTGMTLEGEEITKSHTSYIEAAKELYDLTVEEVILSNRPEWDSKHNLETLQRYVECQNDLCENTMFSQDSHAPRWKIEGYNFNEKLQTFHCEKCGEISHSECEYNEDSDLYVFPEKFTIIMSAYNGIDRYNYISKVEADTPRNALAAAIRIHRQETNSHGNIYLIHLATYAGHLKPILEGEDAYKIRNPK